MEWLEILKAIILGIVQGITEWLPVSSTGHMILVNQFLKLGGSDNFFDVFLVVIQFGSILAVVTLFFHKLNPFSPKKSEQEKMDTITMWLKVLVAILPAVVVALLFEDKIDALFFNPQTVSATLIIYGLLFIWIERKNKIVKVETISELSYKMALMIGLFQVLALIPGTSRSGATILGAILIGTSRYVAAEFSFFLAIPVMFGASFLKLVKYGASFNLGDWGLLLVGTAIAYIISILAIRFLLDYIKKNDFTAFGYYRIILGVVIIAYFMLTNAQIA